MQLIVESRNIFGKKLKKKRGSRKFPAVLYGAKMKNQPLFVDFEEFKRIWREAGESTIVKLKHNNSGDTFDVLIHSVDIDPLKNEPIHADFLAVEMDKPIITKVPLVFEGVAPAAKELGGVLVKVLHEIEVEALPKDLPHELKVDVSKLVTFEDKIILTDIVLPAGVKIIGNPEEVVALVEIASEEEISTEEPSLEKIEVEKRGKKEEETSASHE